MRKGIQTKYEVREESGIFSIGHISFKNNQYISGEAWYPSKFNYSSNSFITFKISKKSHPVTMRLK